MRWASFLFLARMRLAWQSWQSRSAWCHMAFILPDLAEALLDALASRLLATDLGFSSAAAAGFRGGM